MTMPSQASALTVRESLDLPPLPVVGRKLLALNAAADVDVDDFLAVVELDPALAGRLVGLARSAYFGDAKNIDTLQEAVLRALGLETALGLATSLALTEQFSSAAFSCVRERDYWTMAIMTAELAKQVARHAPLDSGITPALAYLAGSLHNVGILTLAHNFTADFKRVINAVAGMPTWTHHMIEAELLGIDHHQAGALLACRWDLPEVVVLAIENCNDEYYDGKGQALAHLIGSCSRTVQHRQATQAPLARFPDTGLRIRISDRHIQDSFRKFEENYTRIQELAQLMVAAT